jgi:hypothetical protein
MKQAKESKFTKYFIKANGLSDGEFDEWVLSSDMLFEATNGWWGNQTKRKSPHEGIDVGFYRNRNKKVIGFDESIRISALFDGVVVGVFSDFIGQSILMRHTITDSRNRELCSIFGHINPRRDIFSKKILKEGDIVGRIANAGKSSVKPHVHITMGWAEKEITDDVLNWKVIGTSEVLELIDPIKIIGKYSLVPHSTIFPKYATKE